MEAGIVDFEQQITKSNNFAFIPLRNIFLKSTGAFLMSSVPITGDGGNPNQRGSWSNQLPTKLKNDPSTVVTVISGSHGTGSLLQKQSGFTDYNLMEPHFYNEDFQTIKNMQNSNHYNQITFRLLNIKDYHCCEKVENGKGCPYPYKDSTTGIWYTRYKCRPAKPFGTHYKQQKKRLVDDIKGKGTYFNFNGSPAIQKTTLLVLAFCFSLNGDVCLAMRSDGDLSRIILEAEMRKIGIKNARLSPDQVDVLQSAASQTPGALEIYLQIKDFILTGKFF